MGVGVGVGVGIGVGVREGMGVLVGVGIGVRVGVGMGVDVGVIVGVGVGVVLGFFFFLSTIGKCIRGTLMVGKENAYACPRVLMLLTPKWLKKRRTRRKKRPKITLI